MRHKVNKSELNEVPGYYKKKDPHWRCILSANSSSALVDSFHKNAPNTTISP